MKLVFNLYTLLILALICGAPSCKDNVSIQYDSYLIVGTTHSQIADYISPSYMLTDNGAFKSTTYLKPGGKLDSHREKLSEEKKHALEALRNNLPTELLNNESSEETFGCPGCADQPGYYLEFLRNGKVRKYIIDSNYETESSELGRFTALFSEKLKILSSK